MRYFGELLALDRSLGALRRGLRELGLENSTLLWFNSDNGPEEFMRPFNPTGGLKGSKKTLWEGGIRVPAIVEWPGVVRPGVSWTPTSIYDILPTVLELIGVPSSMARQPQDGMSVARLLLGEDDGLRAKPIPIQYKGRAILIDNELKLWCTLSCESSYTVYNLSGGSRLAQRLLSNEDVPMVNYSSNVRERILEMVSTTRRIHREVESEKSNRENSTDLTPHTSYPFEDMTHFSHTQIAIVLGQPQHFSDFLKIRSQVRTWSSLLQNNASDLRVPKRSLNFLQAALEGMDPNSLNLNGSREMPANGYVACGGPFAPRSSLFPGVSPPPPPN